MTYTATDKFNTVSDDASNVSAPGDVSAKVRTTNPLAQVLINTSTMDHELLTYQGLDISAGFEALATGLTGSSEVNFNKGFSGHNVSIEQRMNPILYTYDANYRLLKVGELKTFGFGRSGLKKVGVDSSTGKDVFSGYETRGRNIYCPCKISPDGITYKPYLLWNQRYFMLTEMIYADSEHCYAADWGYQIRQMQGLFILWMMQNDPKSGDTRAYATRRLARTLQKDAEKGLFIYNTKVDHAVKALGMEKAFSA